MIARQQGLDVQCSPDGAFQPLQVQTDEDELYHVVCVQPSDGSSISGTEIIVADMDDTPDCDRLGECMTSSTVPRDKYFSNVIFYCPAFCLIGIGMPTKALGWASLGFVEDQLFEVIEFLTNPNTSSGAPM